MLSLYSRTNSTTAQLLVLSKHIFHLKPTALFHSSWFSNFYNHSPDFQLEILSLSDHKPSALPHSFWFFPFYENVPRGFRVKLLLYSRAISTTVQLLVFLKKKFSLSNINHQHYFTASGFPNIYHKPPALPHSCWSSIDLPAHKS